MVEIDKLMAHATISSLKAGRKLGVEDMGLLEDWEDLIEEASETGGSGK